MNLNSYVLSLQYLFQNYKSTTVCTIFKLCYHLRVPLRVIIYPPPTLYHSNKQLPKRTRDIDPAQNAKQVEIPHPLSKRLVNPTCPRSAAV